jgi:Tuberculosis necrotizing toxin
MFLGAAGAPYSQRSLPPANLNAVPNDLYPFNCHINEVARPFLVTARPIAGAFGQQGLGNAVCDAR